MLKSNNLPNEPGCGMYDKFNSGDKGEDIAYPKASQRPTWAGF